MPNHKKNHEENRKCVCILCFRKPKGQLRNLSDKMRQLFINYVLTDDTNGLSDMSFSWLPTTLCVSCKKLLGIVAKNPKMALKHVDFASLTPPQVFRGEVVTRSSLEVECGCSVCEVARMDNVGFKYIKYKMGMSDPKGKTPWLETGEESLAKVGSVVHCRICLSEYGRGKRHSCNPAVRREHLDILIRNSSNKSKQKVLSSQLKEVVGEQGVERGEETLLVTGGKPLPVTVGRKKREKPSPFFTNEKLLKLQAKLEISDRKTKLAANFLRVELGKKAVEQELRAALVESNHKLDNLFTIKKLKLEESVKEKEDENPKKKKTVYVEKEQEVIICTDVELLVAKVIEKRNLDPDDTLIQIGLDDGQSQLKVNLRLILKLYLY